MYVVSTRNSVFSRIQHGGNKLSALFLAECVRSKYRTTTPTGTNHNPSTSKPQSWYIAPTRTTAYFYLLEGFRMRKEKINASICTPEQRWFGKGASTSIWHAQQHCIINLQWCITFISGWMWRRRLVVMHKIGPHTIFWVCLQLQWFLH